MSEAKEQINNQPRHPASVRVKDNIFRYGAGTVAAAVLAGAALNEFAAFFFVLLAGLTVGSVAMMLEAREDRRNAPKPQDLEDLQMLIMELTQEVKKLPPGYSPSSSKALESKLEKLEQDVKTLNQP